MFDDYTEVKTYNSNPLVHSYFNSALYYFLDDNKYTYYEIFEGETDWLDTISRNIWATVTLNWSHKDEAQKIVTEFLQAQADEENIESLANEAEKEMGINLAMQVIDLLTGDIVETSLEHGGRLWDSVEAIDKFAHLKINMKKWISAGNFTKNTNNWWKQFNNHIKQYNKWNKSWTWVSKIGNVMSWLPVVSVTLDEIDAFATCAKTYSALAATSEHFIIFEDILEAIVNNDNMDEKYVAKGVQPILNSIRNSNYNFTSDFCRDLSVQTAENLGQIAITLLSVHNPLLIAINIVVGLVDDLWLRDITEGTYALYVVKELVDASKSLIDYEYGSTLCSFEESEKIYLRFIYSARKTGGEYGKQIINKQTFKGEKDSVARERIRKAIDSDNKFLDSYKSQLKLDP